VNHIAKALPITDNNIDSIDYPIICTPKTTGLRCITDWRGILLDEVGNEIKNNHVRNKVQEYGIDGLDGEICIDGEGSWEHTVRILQDPSLTPDFTFVVGDIISNEPYHKRISSLDTLVTKPRPDFIKIKTPATVYNKEGLLEYWKSCALQEYHGIYAKQGGCGYMAGDINSFEWNVCLVYTNWATGWAIISNFKEKNGVLDHIEVYDKYTKCVFTIRHGFDSKQRRELWKNRAQYTGYTVSYEYQPTGSNVPTTPICKKVSRR